MNRPYERNVLHYLSTRVNLHKDSPGYPGDLHTLVRRVRLVKCCGMNWDAIDFDGTAVDLPCTAKPTYLVTWHNDDECGGPIEPNTRQLACNDCATKTWNTSDLPYVEYCTITRLDNGQVVW